MNLGGAQSPAAMAMAAANPSLSNLSSSLSPLPAAFNRFPFFHPLLKPPRAASLTPRVLLYRPRLISLRHPPQSQPFRSRRLPVFSFAEDSSKPSDDIDVEDKDNGHLKEQQQDGAEESQEERAWKETLASFKEQALKLQCVSQEAYQLYSQKTVVLLNQTAEKLKIQADKARQDLSVIAKEIALESKEYLSSAAENSPEPVKDIVETFASSADELNQVSKVRDFYVGIPYGALLSGGGFLSFMITGSLSAVRFGVILGGVLLALAILSLRSWKRGESSFQLLKGQAAISTILFLREVRLLFSRPFIANFISALISGAVAGFYAYRIVVDREQEKGSNLEGETGI